jgi:gliding motility-associated-like protein
VYVPNSFTPDGNAFNNTFLPILTGDYLSNYELQIYNKWGELVFVSNDIQVGWDGTFQGVKVKTDSYIWTILYSNLANNEASRVSLNGHVSVLY